jgi:cell division protein FtsW
MLKKNADKAIFLTVSFLIILGLVMLVSASSELGKAKFGDPYYFLKHQSTYGLAPGILGFLLGLFLPLKFFRRAALPFLLLNVLGLILIFTPLGGHYGTADRWLVLGPFNFQPSEALKFTFMLYLAAWLASRVKNRRTDFWESFVPFITISGIIAFILFSQPSTSTVLILMLSALTVYFVNGARWSYIAGLIFLGAIAFTAVIIVTPYRLQRVTSFVHTDADPQGSRYHLNQSLIAIGSGGWVGAGYGNSVSKIRYLPEPIGDSIFSIIAEEFGFLGAIFFILLYFILVIAGIRGSRGVRNQFGRLTLVGFSTVIGLQAFIHIASVSGLLPMTGVPLPFISYGGTSLVSFMTMSGLMINVLRNA